MADSSSCTQKRIAPLLTFLGEHPEFITVKIMDGIVEELLRNPRNADGDDATGSPRRDVLPEGGSGVGALRGAE